MKKIGIICRDRRLVGENLFAYFRRSFTNVGHFCTYHFFSPLPIYSIHFIMVDFTARYFNMWDSCCKMVIGDRTSRTFCFQQGKETRVMMMCDPTFNIQCSRCLVLLLKTNKEERNKHAAYGNCNTYIEGMTAAGEHTSSAIIIIIIDCVANWWLVSNFLNSCCFRIKLQNIYWRYVISIVPYLKGNIVYVYEWALFNWKIFSSAY